MKADLTSPYSALKAVLCSRRSHGSFAADSSSAQITEAHATQLGRSLDRPQREGALAAPNDADVRLPGASTLEVVAGPKQRAGDDDTY